MSQCTMGKKKKMLFLDIIKIFLVFFLVLSFKKLKNYLTLESNFSLETRRTLIHLTSKTSFASNITVKTSR
jgi:hypothetical protein